MDRNLADSLISSESANHLTDAGERLFLRIVAARTTDNWGRRKASPSALRGDCVPLLGWPDEKLAGALGELVEQDMVVVYTVAGCDYLAVTNWDRYQRKLAGLRSRHGKSRFPAPPDLASAGGDVGAHEHGVAVPSTDRLSKNQPSAAEKDLADQNPTVVNVGPARANAEPSLDWRLLEGVARYRAISLHLRGADERTPIALLTAAKGLPEAAIHTALESLDQRRGRRPALASEARYMVATLATMKREEQYVGR